MWKATDHSRAASDMSARYNDSVYTQPPTRGMGIPLQKNAHVSHAENPTEGCDNRRPP